MSNSYRRTANFSQLELQYFKTQCVFHMAYKILYTETIHKKLIDVSILSIVIMTFRGFIILFRSVTRNFADFIDLSIINKPWNEIYILQWHEFTNELETCYKYFESCLKVILSLRYGRANFIVSRINYSNIMAWIQRSVKIYKLFPKKFN